MKVSRSPFLLVMIVLLVLATARQAGAATATANLSVTASVIQACVVTGGTLAFGSYDPTAGANVDQTGTFQVACTKGSTGVTIGLGLGANASGAQRRMTNGTDFLNYELYKEAARTNIWGNAGTALVSYAPVTTSGQTTFTAFGRVPSGQTNVGVGATYTDTVVITVTF
ncbi:MAG: spore coat U domain-containing protein [Vicinamibacterales bacterium]